MDMLFSPLVLNIAFYGLLLLLAFIGLKGADGFFAVGIMYAVIGMCGFVGPFVIGTLNVLLYFLTKDSGFLVGIGVAIGTFVLFYAYAFLDSRSFYVDHFVGKKIKATFEEATQLNPTTYIQLVLDGGKHGATKIYFKEMPTAKQLASFEGQLQTTHAKKSFELYLKNDFFQQIQKNAYK